MPVLPPMKPSSQLRTTQKMARPPSRKDTPPVRPADIDGRLESADGFKDCGDGHVGHGVGGAGVRLDDHGLGLGIAVGVFLEAKDADDMAD